MNIGPMEIAIVLILALLVFGPKRLPQAGRSLGQAMRELKKATSAARSDLGIDDVAADVKDLKSSIGLDDVAADVKDLKSSMTIDLKSAGKPATVAAATATAVVADAPASVPGTTNFRSAKPVAEAPASEAASPPKRRFRRPPDESPESPDAPGQTSAAESVGEPVGPPRRMFRRSPDANQEEEAAASVPEELATAAPEPVSPPRRMFQRSDDNIPSGVSSTSSDD